MIDEDLTLNNEEQLKSTEAVNKLPSSNWGELISGVLMMVCLASWFLLFVDKLVMPLVVRKGVEVTIPNFHLIPFNEADSISSSLGLKLVRGRERVDRSLSAGIVVDQFPPAGSIVKPGKRVEVVHTIESEVILCPELVGRSPREAVLIADSLTLFVDDSKIRYAHSDRYPDGVVIRQVPESLMSMTGGDTITVVVSVGPAPTEIRAPMLVGQKLEDIQRLLIKNNVRLGKVTRYPDSSVPPNTILSQVPEFDSRMNSRDKIDVRVAIKPKSAVETE